MNFNYADGDGPNGLIFGSDGNLYGATGVGGTSENGTIFRMTPAGVLTTLWTFNFATDGFAPGPLMLASDGNFYGTTQQGGANNDGTVFKITPCGVLTTLHTFNGADGLMSESALVQGGDGNFYGTTGYGGAPGNTPGGNNVGNGTVFMMTPAGALSTLTSFTNTNGRDPGPTLLFNSDGNYYGLTGIGGANNEGNIFSITPFFVTASTGTSFSYQITATGSPTAYAATGLPTGLTVNTTTGLISGSPTVPGSYSVVLSATNTGGTGSNTLLITVTSPPPLTVATTTLPNGTASLFYLQSLSAAGGSAPYTWSLVSGSMPAGLTFYNTGFIVGEPTTPGTTNFTVQVTGNDGASTTASLSLTILPPPAPVISGPFTVTGIRGYPLSYQINAAGLPTSYTATGLPPGLTLNATTGLISGTPGAGGQFNVSISASNITGTGTANLSFSLATPRPNILLPFSVITNFNESNGQLPEAALTQGSDGLLYGTTVYGGAGYEGTVFKVTPAGALTTLASFNGLNGEIVRSGVVQASDGNFYGTTAQGGMTSQGGASYSGTVFKLSPAGSLTTLLSFDGSDGANPWTGLTQGTDGNLYGTTTASYGSIYKITTGGVITTLCGFSNTNGGLTEPGTLLQASDGNFYGTAAGGASGEGAVFKMTPSGGLTTLCSFGFPNGEYPVPGLIQAADGNFYGTTASGGISGYGTVFQMTPAGVLTTLCSFNGTNGSGPNGLIQGPDQNFYGATAAGGSNNLGSIFMVTPSGTITTLYSFTGTGGNGSNPQ